MVAGEHGVFLLQCEAQVVADVPRGVQRLDGVPRAVDDVAVGECRLRIKVDVGCVLSLELRVVLDLRLVRRVGLAAGFTLIVGVVVVLTLAEGRVGVGSEPEHRRAGCIGQRRCCRGVIAMGVGDEDVANAHAAKQRRDIDHLAVMGLEVDDEHGSGHAQAPRAWRALTVSRQMRTAMKVSPAKIMKAVSSWA